MLFFCAASLEAYHSYMCCLKPNFRRPENIEISKNLVDSEIEKELVTLSSILEVIYFTHRGRYVLF